MKFGIPDSKPLGKRYYDSRSKVGRQIMASTVAKDAVESTLTAGQLKQREEIAEWNLKVQQRKERK